jgi:hypothetical protein
LAEKLREPDPHSGNEGIYLHSGNEGNYPYKGMRGNYPHRGMSSIAIDCKFVLTSVYESSKQNTAQQQKG